MDLASLQIELARQGAPQLVAGWTNEEFLNLLEMYTQKCTLDAMMKHFGRSRGQILGLLFRARAKGLIEKVHENPVRILRNPKRVDSKIDQVERKIDPAAISEAQLVQRIVRQRLKKRRVRLRLIEDKNQVTFSQLERHHCRWPIGDPRQPDFRFCGCPRIENKPYCREHSIKATRAYERGEV